MADQEIPTSDAGPTITTIPDWDPATANGRRRVKFIGIHRPMGDSDTVCEFHVERVFVDENDVPLSRTIVGIWQLEMMKGIADPELREHVIAVAQGLEAISQILYARGWPYAY